MSQFNENNQGHINGYPLFLGEDLGLFDTVNRTYPVLEELYQEQLAQLWNEFEVDLTQDKLDMQTVDPRTVDLMVKTLSWQFLADSVAGRSISGLLLKHCSNPELEGLISLWSFFEVIHARTYSHIVKQTFTDANEMLNETYANMDVILRSDVIVMAFDRLEAADGSDIQELEDALLQSLVAMFALEAIAFMASFAVTFSLVETKVFQGIGKLVQLICRDEVLHTRFDFHILDILMREDRWQAALYRNESTIKEIINSVVLNEYRWADYIFSEGRQVVGLNVELLQSYVDYMAAPVYATFGIDAHAPEKNPLPYMDKYIDPSKVQTANQELQNGSYLVGTLEDDTADLELDLDEL